MGAALCIWFLRAWKIGEQEAIAAYKGQDLDQVNALDAESLEFRTAISTASCRESSVVKRLFAWKKV